MCYLISFNNCDSFDIFMNHITFAAVLSIGRSRCTKDKRFLRTCSLDACFTSRSSRSWQGRWPNILDPTTHVFLSRNTSYHKKNPKDKKQNETFFHEHSYMRAIGYSFSNTWLALFPISSINNIVHCPR